LKRRLVILSASVRTKATTVESLPALELFDGVFARQIRKYIRDGLIDRRDVLFVSPTLGLIRGLQPVRPDKMRNLSDWHKPVIDSQRLFQLNQIARKVLRTVTRTEKYSEAFVNVGKNLYPIIDGIETIVSCPIIHARGRGIGPKSADMKAWSLGYSQSPKPSLR